MNHWDLIQKEFRKSAVIDSDWWKKLPREEQLKYIKQHRQTKLRPTPETDESRRTIQLLGSIPKNWKNDLVRSKGVGKNSKLIQLPDALRGKLMRDAFKNGAVAIVAFKSGTPITKMDPEFFITPSYEQDKYNAVVVKDAEGNPIEEKHVYKEKQRYRRGSRYRHGGSYVDRIRDLRMGPIIEGLPDRAYNVYAIKVDPSRMQKRQQRSSEAYISKRRAVENTLIANEIKPIYDYYSAKLQSNLEILRDAAVPSLNSIIEKDRYARLPGEDKMQKAIDEVKQARDKMSSLSSAIDSVRYNELPAKDTPIYNPESSRDKDKAKKFVEKVKELKTRFKDEYKYAYKQKVDDAVSGLTSGILKTENRLANFLDSIDALKSIKRRDLAGEVLNIMNETQDAGIDQEALSRIREKQAELVKKISAIRYNYDNE